MRKLNSNDALVGIAIFSALASAILLAVAAALDPGRNIGYLPVWSFAGAAVGLVCSLVARRRARSKWLALVAFAVNALLLAFWLYALHERLEGPT